MHGMSTPEQRQGEAAGVAWSRGSLCAGRDRIRDIIAAGGSSKIAACEHGKAITIRLALRSSLAWILAKTKSVLRSTVRWFPRGAVGQEIPTPCKVLLSEHDIAPIAEHNAKKPLLL